MTNDAQPMTPQSTQTPNTQAQKDPSQNGQTQNDQTQNDQTQNAQPQGAQAIKTSSQKKRVSGVILIDKPKGFSSQQVVAKVKYLFQSPRHNSKKAGHTGTLDPMATGLLPVCLGEATKFSHYQLNADKRYTSTIKLGIQTDTGDAEGKIIATAPIPALNQQQLDSVASSFTGDILQTPPMYSALKKDGKKLYEYARAGIEVDRPARALMIHALSLTMGDTADTIDMDVTCSKGTYVRVLGEDIAKSLGTLGHLIALRRVAVGDFSLQLTNEHVSDNLALDAHEQPAISNRPTCIGLEALEALSFDKRFDYLWGIDACILSLPTFFISNAECDRLQLGQRLNIAERITSDTYSQLAHDFNELAPEATLDIRLFNNDGQFLGLGQVASTGRLQPKKMIQD